LLLVLLILAVILFTIPSDISLAFLQRAAVRLPDFATIFLGIFIEAAPFLLVTALPPKGGSFSDYARPNGPR